MQNKKIEEFYERLSQYYTKLDIDTIKKFSSEKPITFRVNTLKRDKQEVINELIKEKFKPKNWLYENTFYLEDAKLKDLKKTAAFKNGEIYLQSFASMLPVIALNPKEGERILDTTSAPGSKTSQIASLMKNKGSLTALELNQPRYERLVHNLNLLGVDTIEFCKHHNVDANFFLKNLEDSFDKILLDAPCSSSSRICLEDKSTYLKFRPENFAKFAKVQMQLLKSAYSKLKPNGTLVYSTCSIDPAENFELISQFLKEHTDASLCKIENLQKVECIKPNLSINQDVLNKTIQVMPNKFIESFYIALIKKAC